MTENYAEDVREMSTEEIHQALADHHEAIWKHRQRVERLQYERDVLHTELQRRENSKEGVE